MKKDKKTEKQRKEEEKNETERERKEERHRERKKRMHKMIERQAKGRSFFVEGVRLQKTEKCSKATVLKL
jgi:hypothetical protein